MAPQIGRERVNLFVKLVPLLQRRVASENQLGAPGNATFKLADACWGSSTTGEPSAAPAQGAPCWRCKGVNAVHSPPRVSVKASAGFEFVAEAACAFALSPVRHEGASRDV